MFEAWYGVESFAQRGGPVLVPIGLVLIVMWALIAERVWYLLAEHRGEIARVRAEWQGRRERSSWHARRIRAQLISQVSSRLSRGLGLIQTLVGLCTLLGLLGTVTGMIQIFDTMALTGSSSARLMADGVSRATIPTLAGLVAAVSGLGFSVGLQNVARRETQRVADALGD